MTSGGPLSVFIIGTRAQLIKVAPVIVACEQRSQPVLMLMTGQHKETMLDLVEEFGITSRMDVAIVASERSTVVSLVLWAPRALLALVGKLRSLKSAADMPRIVVHGDTMSTVLGAFAAKLCGMQVFHLESGLTSGRLFDPFPEELSRRIVFRMTDVAICPSAEATAHMQSGYACRAVDTGENTIVDAVMMATARVGGGNPGAMQGPYLVASLHRFQNIFDKKRLRYLTSLLVELSGKYPIHFVLHPATRKRLEAEGLLEQIASAPNLQPSPRLGYSEFLALAANAACVLTDGGSNQEELAVLGVPTIVMRQATERADGLGENAIMEGDVGQDLLAYLLAGDFLALRRPSRVRAQMGPSARVAELLAS